MIDFIKRYPTLSSLVVFIISTAVFFAPTVFSDKVPLPTDLVHDYLLDEQKLGDNGLIRDSVVQMYPNLHVVFTAYTSGDFSGWNPYIFGGIDMYGTGQSMALSPVVVFMPLFDTSLQFFSFVVILYFLLSGIAMYFFLRSLGYAHGVAVFGGIVFQMSGPMLGWMAWGTISGVIACVPLMLLAVHKYVQSKNLWWIVLLTLANYTSLTAGHLQFYMYGLLLTVAYMLYLLWQKRAELNITHWLFLGGAACINAIIIYLVTKPFMVALALSHRTELSDVSRLSPLNLLQLIDPNIWGDVNTYTGPLNYLESLAYIGFLPILILVIGLFFRRLVPWKQSMFWWVIVAVTLVYNVAPEITLPISYVFPFLESFPPFRSLFIIDIGLIIIVVHILQHVLVHLKQRQDLRIVYLIVLAWANAYFVLGGFTPQQDITPFTQPPAYVSFLLNQADQPLIYSELSPLNLYSVYGIRSIFGYDSTYPESYYQKIKDHGEIISHRNILNAKITDRDFLRQLGVEYIVTKRELQNIQPIYDESGIKIYQL